MTDRALILDVLWDMEWHHVLVIIERCKPGAVNWPARSRISDLKNIDHYDIESRRAADGMSEYRLRSREKIRLGQMKLGIKDPAAAAPLRASGQKVGGECHDRIDTRGRA